MSIRFYFFLLVIVLIASCRSIKITPKVSNFTSVKDSISKQVNIVDTLVIVRKSDTVKLKQTIDKLTSNAIVKRSNYASLSIKKVGNTIEAECIADELKELLEIQREIIKHYKEINQQQQETIVVPQKYIPELLKPLIWIGGIVLTLVIGGLAMRILKFKVI